MIQAVGTLLKCEEELIFKEKLFLSEPKADFFTARSLLTVSKKSKKKADVLCLFCNKNQKLQRFKIVTLIEIKGNIYRYIFSGFSFSNIHDSQGSSEREGYLFYCCPPLPPGSRTLRHWPGNYCRGITSTHSQQADSNWEPLVSERKSLTTKLCALEKEGF